MRYELWLGWRYLLARRRERFVSLISLLSVGGVALGVGTLIVVLSVMSGFSDLIEEKIIGMNPHVVVTAAGGIPLADDWLALLSEVDGVTGVAPFVDAQALARLDDRITGVMVRGIDTAHEYGVTDLQQYIIGGSPDLTGQHMLIGQELAFVLDAHLGSTVELVSPIDGTSHAFVISGVFESGNYLYDAQLVFLSLEGGQRLLSMPGLISGLGVRVETLDQSAAVAGAIRRRLGVGFQTQTWQEMNRNLFRALWLEKLMMGILLTLIIVVASANIASTLITMVTEKTKEIGVLKALGATPRSILALFTVEGVTIGVLGAVCGLALGIGIAWFIGASGIVKLPPDIYYIDRLPVRVHLHDVILTMGIAIGIGLLSTVYPAWQASRLDPAEALRYE